MIEKVFSLIKVPYIYILGLILHISLMRDLVTVRFLPMPSAPILQSKVFKVSASQKFETIVRFLRKKLGCKDTDSVFCYVNSVFAPGLDEGIGGLWRVCFLVFFISFLYSGCLTECVDNSVSSQTTN